MTYTKRCDREEGTKNIKGDVEDVKYPIQKMEWEQEIDGAGGADTMVPTSLDSTFGRIFAVLV